MFNDTNIKTINDFKFFDIETNNCFSQRFFDVIFAVFCLISLSPLFLFISILILIFDGNGSIFYKEKRIGLYGKAFTCFKFRTMKKNSAQLLESILSKNLRLKQKWEKYLKIEKDPRVTFIGKFLRKTFLDEIPQFVNVLKGDLSVVGPRPRNLEEAKRTLVEDDIKKKILSIKPGLTGLWQIMKNKNLMPLNEKLAIDVKYIKNKSFLLDIKIICKTFYLIIRSVFSLKNKWN